MSEIVMLMWGWVLVFWAWLAGCALGSLGILGALRGWWGGSLELELTTRAQMLEQFRSLWAFVNPRRRQGRPA